MTIKQDITKLISTDGNGNAAVVNEANDGKKAVPVELVKKSSDDSTFTQVSDSNPIPVSVKGNLAAKAVSVTPSDTVDLTDGATKGLYVGGFGDVSVTMSDGTSAVFKGLSTGMIHPISVKRVKATGTTATSIIGVY